jgi:hypothetical protein
MLSNFFCCYVLDLLYRQTVNVQNSQLDVEIMDVSGETVSFFYSPECFLNPKRIKFKFAPRTVRRRYFQNMYLVCSRFYICAAKFRT